MKPPLIVLCLGMAGCSTFSTTQVDERIDAKTGEKTTVTTKAASTTFFDSHSALSQFRAIQTEKSQQATVGSLNQDTSGTNVTKLIEIIVRGMMEGALKAAAAP